uniref:BOS complex subunit TMEM147 n=1 Tax=Sarcophilus harrisii TaxID=9305 RepID=A0A7N4NSM5_SARHA
MPPTPSRHRQTQNKLKATHFWQPSPPKPSPWSVHYKITRENTYLLYTATVKTAAKTAPPTPPLTPLYPSSQIPLPAFFPTPKTKRFTAVHYIAVSALVWMFTRYDLPRNFRPPLTLLLGISVYKAFILEAFVHLFSLGSWTALLVRAVMTGVLALSSLSLFVTLVHGN